MSYHPHCAGKGTTFSRTTKTIPNFNKSLTLKPHPLKPNTYDKKALSITLEMLVLYLSNHPDNHIITPITYPYL